MGKVTARAQDSGLALMAAAGTLTLAVGLSALAPLCLAAKTNPAPLQESEGKGAELTSRRLELKGMEDTIESSQERRRKIEAEIAAIHADRAKLNAALLEATQDVSATERKVAETEGKLDTLTGSEEAIKRSLESRRAVIGEVLASLQRMGRKPPPALLATPEDVLSAIRTSMMLGAVLPQMRSEVEALVSDLSDLMQLRQSVAAEREELANHGAKLRAERERLAALIEARQAALASAEQALDRERQHAAELAKQAASLKDLITRMETEVAAAARGAEAARKADEARARAGQGGGSKAALGPFREPARLAPAVSFVETKGLLPFPVNGTLERGFGSQDGLGGTEKGVAIATRSEAIVTSPCDGWVAFAGPYRSYGQLLIINAGQGYYIILAGMDKINVNVGQFILAGEPVAVMGDGSAKTAAAIAIGAAEPVLYVEFRKDGVAIDPSPWWAKPAVQKVRG